MHDIDRTQAESWETAFESDQFEYGNGLAGEAVFDEADEMELASQLLEISDEAELDQFLGALIKKAARAAGGIIRSPIGKQLGGMLKGAAKQYLPMAGSALGNWIAPGAGGALGGKAASTLGSVFGLELEGLSGEDQEFEVARQFVRLAGEATTQATQAPPTASPTDVAKSAVAAAAQQYAPGLLRGGARTNGGSLSAGGQAYASGGTQARSGRWYRRGRKIILLGV